LSGDWAICRGTEIGQTGTDLAGNGQSAMARRVAETGHLLDKRRRWHRHRLRLADQGEYSRQCLPDLSKAFWRGALARRPRRKESQPVVELNLFVMIPCEKIVKDPKKNAGLLKKT
jgi:hypothetical protein